MSVTGVTRQVQLERLPVRAVVERDEHAELGAGVQQALAIRILTHDARRPVRRNAVLAVGQPRPGLAVVVGAVDVRLVVAEQVTVRREVRRSLAMRRGLDELHASARR